MATIDIGSMSVEIRLEGYSEVRAKLDTIIDLLFGMAGQIEGGFTMTQASIDTLTATVNALADEAQNIDDEIQALKAANPSLDTSALEAAVSGLKAKLDQAATDGQAVAASTGNGDTGTGTTTPPPLTDDSGNLIQP